MTEDDKLPDVWHTRDYPVLKEVARLIDSGAFVAASDRIATAVGISEADCKLAVKALERRGLVRLAKSYGHHLQVQDITGEAYLLTGLHPSGDDALSSLVATLREAADQVADPEEKSRLRKIADGFLGLPSNVSAAVLTAWLSAQVPT